MYYCLQYIILDALFVGQHCDIVVVMLASDPLCNQCTHSLTNSHVCEWPQMVHEQHSRMQFAALEIGRASKDGTLHE